MDFSNLPNPQVALYNLGAGPGESLVDNRNFMDPIDQRQGHIVPPGTAYYSDSDMTQQAGTTTEYVKAVQSGSSWTITVDGNTCYVSGEAVVRGYTEPGYTIDRWMIAQCMCALQAGGIKLTKNTDADYAAFQQLIPNAIDENDNTVYTLSALIGGKLFTGTGAGYNLIASAEGTENLVRIYQGKNIEFVLFDDAPLLQAAKLELGPVQTLAHQDADGSWVLNDPPPNRVQELAKCQRYQLFIGNYGQWYASAINYTSGVAFIPTPVPMRCNPTIYKFGQNNPQDYGACYISTDSMRITDIAQIGTATNNGVSVALTGLSRNDYGGCGAWGEVGLMLDSNL